MVFVLGLAGWGEEGEMTGPNNYEGSYIRQYIPRRQYYITFMNRDYLIRVWLTTIITAPIIFMLLSAVLAFKTSQADPDTFYFVLFSMLFGFILSIPTLLICILLFSVLEKKLKNPLEFKAAILLVASLGMFLTFFILYGPKYYIPAGLRFSILYGICILLAGFFYRVR